MRLIPRKGGDGGRYDMLQEIADLTNRELGPGGQMIKPEELWKAPEQPKPPAEVQNS